MGEIRVLWKGRNNLKRTDWNNFIILVIIYLPLATCRGLVVLALLMVVGGAVLAEGTPDESHTNN